MKHYLLLYFVLFLFSSYSCKNSSKELELKERELEIKERELNLREAEKERTKEVSDINYGTSYTKTESPSKINMFEPKEQVLAFLNEIGKDDFKTAYQRQNNKYWKPFSKFISKDKGYGGTKDVEIYESSLIEQTGNYAKVFVHYFAADPYNRDGIYRQFFELRKENGDWLIYNAFLEKNTKKRSIYSSGSSSVNFYYDGKIIKVPAIINNTVRVEFILDSGASDVFISLDYASVLAKSGTLTEYDYIGQAQYQMADGSIANAHRVILREISIGNFTLHNIVASISENMDASLLLGQSFLQKFGSVKIDYNNNIIYFEN